MIYERIDALIGNTPLLHLTQLERELGLNVRLVAKLESFNPGGSAKDRVARAILDDAEARGVISPGSVIIEPTSGNTGIGIASLAAARGYKAVIVMPETMSKERQLLMHAYGAELVLTNGKDGMAGAIAEAERIKEKTPGSIIAGQFVNPENPRAHYLTTGPEIFRDCDGAIDYFVAGVGTGGTITGVGEYLKEQKPEIKIIGAEPADSPVLSGGAPGAHKLQGIGAGFIPEVLNTSLLDGIEQISTEEAYEMTRTLARCCGVLAGISSGAALAAAIRVARREEAQGKTVVVLLPDTGERYLTSGVF